MKILNTTYVIRKTNKGYYLSNLFSSGKPTQVEEKDKEAIDKIYRILRVNRLNYDTKKIYISNVCKKYGYTNLYNQLNKIVHIGDFPETTTTETPENVETRPMINIDDVKTAIDNLINFFTEFEFEPNFRFINTFTRCANISKKMAKDYALNYFKLSDNSYTNALTEKMKSAEFDSLLSSFEMFKTEKKINNRFKLYYGSQGTGKTTKAMKETDGACMVCHSAMLPSDLMEDFKFEDGKATFIPSALQNAMTEGTQIVLDEINLLPFESLRFLQSILDGKASFEYKGKTINIKDGFKIIGTMNLQVNGSIYSLPEPLIDRAEELKEYKLTADNLIGAIL